MIIDADRKLLLRMRNLFALNDRSSTSFFHIERLRMLPPSVLAISIAKRVYPITFHFRVSQNRCHSEELVADKEQLRQSVYILAYIRGFINNALLLILSHLVRN